MSTYVNNISFKEIAKQNRQTGNNFFFDKISNGWNKEVSPDWACCFIMRDSRSIFHVFQFNPFTCDIIELKDDLPNKDLAKQWLDKNRKKHVWIK